MGNTKVSNWIISAVTAVLGVVMIALSLQFNIKIGTGDPGAGFWPVILGGLLLALSIVLFIGTIKNKKALEEKQFAISTPANIRVYILMAIIIGFCVAFYFLGFYIAMILFMPVVMLLLEVKSVKKIIIVTASATVLTYVIFGILLKISMPAAIFMR